MHALNSEECCEDLRLQNKPKVKRPQSFGTISILIHKYNLVKYEVFCVTFNCPKNIYLVADEYKILTLLVFIYI